jgi:uncharacterized protein (TIRG00374 family)
VKYRRFAKILVLPVILLIFSGMYLSADLNVSQVWSAWARFDIYYLSLALLLAVLNILSLGSRLRFLSGGAVDYTNACIVSIVGASLNVLLPAKLGEVTKIALLTQRCKLSLTRTSIIVFWERFFDVNLLILIALVATILGLPPAFGAAVFTFLLVLWLGLILVKYWDYATIILLKLVPAGRVETFFRDAVENLRSSFNLRLLIGGFAYSLIPWGLFTLQIFVVLTLGSMLELTVGQKLLVFLTASLTTAVPLTPGAIGVYEAAVVAVLVQFEIGKELALTTAIVMHSIQYLPALLGVAWALVAFPGTLTSYKQKPSD